MGQQNESHLLEVAMPATDDAVTVPVGEASSDSGTDTAAVVRRTTPREWASPVVGFVTIALSGLMLTWIRR